VGGTNVLAWKLVAGTGLSVDPTNPTCPKHWPFQLAVAKTPIADMAGLYSLSLSAAAPTPAWRRRDSAQASVHFVLQ
jgi:hypothetical protein